MRVQVVERPRIASTKPRLGVKVKAWKTNAGDFAATEVFVNEVLKEFGSIDVCVNNAGISKDNLLMRLSPDQWDDVMNINLKSVYNMTKQVIRPMMKARKGSIINMSSIIGIRGNAGQSSYAASKAGIIQLTRVLAFELGRFQIRINAIAPGGINTGVSATTTQQPSPQQSVGVRDLPSNPLGRRGEPEDIAHAAIYLASPSASFITGQTLVVNGGGLGSL